MRYAVTSTYPSVPAQSIRSLEDSFSPPTAPCGVVCNHISEYGGMNCEGRPAPPRDFLGSVGDEGRLSSVIDLSIAAHAVLMKPFQLPRLKWFRTVFPARAGRSAEAICGFLATNGFELYDQTERIARLHLLQTRCSSMWSLLHIFFCATYWCCC